jgi:16S rRNA (cytosine967-C5)-methyltransferase
MGIKSVQTAAADLTQVSDAARLGRFDRILVDAPCTGLGVLRRHPEAKWHKTEGLIARYAVTQRAILDRVAPLLKPGGVLVYSTCSTEREENEEVVAEFLRRHRGWVSDDLRAGLPAVAASLVTPQGHLLTLGNAWDMDCFFAARFTYRGTP